VEMTEGELLRFCLAENHTCCRARVELVDKKGEIKWSFCNMRFPFAINCEHRQDWVKKYSKFVINK
jgi:hypothetical protein